MANKDDGIKFVVGIDFGTTYSGYVFSLSTDELRFFSPHFWSSGHGGMTSLKIPTSLLLNPDQTRNCFGFEAEDKYAELVTEGRHEDYYLFERFKMELHSKNIQEDSKVFDISGKPVPAMKVFSLSIEYLKEHCLKTINDRGFLPKPENIKFVLTVPAIWNDISKQFMRNAAIKAGIERFQLALALEPEAASIYCQRESFETLENLKIGDAQSKLTKPRTRYLVADIGGGTADFSVHEVEEGGTLTELYRASGGPYGGIYVDKEYLKMLETIFGDRSIDQLKTEDMIEYLIMTREFEVKKRTVEESRDSNFISRLSFVLNGKLTKDEKLEKVQSSYLKDQVSFIKDKITLSPNLMKSFFKNSLENIISHVEQILKAIQDVDIILLVGGYAESPLLQERFKKKFENYSIIIPQDCNLVVMKGAVLFGHNPKSISARILRFTYGDAIDEIFDPKKHPQKNHYVDKNGVERCSNVFRKIIGKNTKVSASGEIVTSYANPLYETQKLYRTRVYCTEKEDIIVVDESCELVGTLDVSVPSHVEGIWKAQERYVFGMTEIEVSAKVEATNQTFETTLNNNIFEEEFAVGVTKK